jgi:hypothetical protein
MFAIRMNLEIGISDFIFEFVQLLKAELAKTSDACNYQLNGDVEKDRV